MADSAKPLSDSAETVTPLDGTTEAMQTDDLILVSIDDHVVEPPDMFLNHVPAKYKAEAPIVVTDDKGVDQWMYQGRPQGVSGLNAVVSWPAEEWGRDPAGFAEMRPGVYDVHERVRDMNRNGILASMCFPTFTGFSARHLNMHREEVTLVMVSAYNDWHIDEWAGSYPDRFIPIAVLPTWNPEAMCAEIRRVAAKGCRAVTMPELPHLEGLPSYHDDDYWGPVFRTLSEENVVMCLHIGTGFGAISMAPNAPIDNLIILATQVSAMCAQDLLWGPAMRSYPDLKFAFSEGGIGWIPFYLDRSDRHYTNQKWLRRDFGDKLPSDVFREHSLACYVTDKTSLKLRHEIGIDIIAWECDYPHSDCFWPDAPEQVLAELNAAGADDSRHQQDHLAELLPVLRLGPVRAHPARAGDGRRAARQGHRRRRVDPAAQGVGAVLRSRSSSPRRDFGVICCAERHLSRRSRYCSAIESPCTRMPLASNGRLAGPLATLPSRLNLLPWQGQLIDAPTTSATVHPACVQMAEKPLNCPGAGCVITTSSTITPEPTGTSPVLAIACTGTAAPSGAAVAPGAGVGAGSAAGSAGGLP